jgi:hypothetical protein
LLAGPRPTAPLTQHFHQTSLLLSYQITSFLLSYKNQSTNPLPSDRMEDSIIQYVNDDCNILTAMQTNTYLINMLLHQKNGAV